MKEASYIISFPLLSKEFFSQKQYVFNTKCFLKWTSTSYITQTNFKGTFACSSECLVQSRKTNIERRCHMWMSLGRIHGNKKMLRYVITQTNKWKATIHLWGDHTTTNKKHAYSWKEIHVRKCQKLFANNVFIWRRTM